MSGHYPPDTDTPRQRLLRAGAAALSDAELLGLLLGAGDGRSATELASEILVKRGGLVGLLRAGAEDLIRSGAGRGRSALVLALVELATRLAKARLPRKELLDQPEAVAAYLALRYARPGQEITGALYLDVRNRLIGEAELYRGTLYATTVEPRAVFHNGLLRTASSFILFHTHPGGDPEPTIEDLVFTRRLAEAGELLGIRLADHLILGDGGEWVSLSRLGELSYFSRRDRVYRSRSRRHPGDALKEMPCRES